MATDFDYSNALLEIVKKNAFPKFKAFVKSKKENVITPITMIVKVANGSSFIPSLILEFLINQILY